MFRRTSEDLGLDIVLKRISHYSLSVPGSVSVNEAKPLFQESAFRTRKAQVSSLMYSLSRARSCGISVNQFPDISGTLDFIVNNPTSSLTGEDVFNIGLYIESAEKLRKLLLLCDESDNINRNAGVQEIIGEPDSALVFLKNDIFRILESPGTVRENYPSVAALREKADKTRFERSRTAARLINDNSLMMQGDCAVLRDGRLALPVKSESKNRIEGYVQSYSQSGSTVFMEPFELIDINNAVILAQQEINIEIARLIKKLSDSVRECEMELRNLASEVRNADFLYSFAVWCTENRCAETITDDAFTVNLISARHPLLGSECVPVDLAVKKDIKAVVLTGPNAGGKTVTMKTVGLFALINQICGHIPASDGSSLALFDRVFTDIGDDQSIQKQLSTFSGHMRSISFILRNMTENSLVILDELGSGTDPQEGAALARSILEYSTERTRLCLTTSHHSVLKQFAYSNKNVLNASMEFNEKTLEPTFRVINGLPGESHAIDTAVRMNLPKSVTDKASAYIGKEAVKISSIIKNLEARKQETEAKLAEAERRLRGIENKENHLKNEEKRLKAYENRLNRNRLGEFDDFITESRKELENLVKQLREGEITREKTISVKNYISRTESKAQTLREKVVQTDEILYNEQLKEINERTDNVPLKVGMEVYCGPSRRDGIIVSQEKNNRWVVAIGSMKFTFKETELVVPLRKNVKTPTYSTEGFSSVPRPKMEIDLRGYRLLEALDAIDNEIESCCVYGIKSFSVIHGYGDGILSAGIHDHLKIKGNVKEYRFASPEDGGQGKTYVTLNIL